MGTDLDQVARMAIAKSTGHNPDQSTNPAKDEALAQLASLVTQPINDSIASSSTAVAMQKRIKELESAQSAPTTNAGKRKASDYVDLSQEHTAKKIFLGQDVQELKGHSNAKITSWVKSLSLIHI